MMDDVSSKMTLTEDESKVINYEDGKQHEKMPKRNNNNNNNAKSNNGIGNDEQSMQSQQSQLG